MTTKRLTDVELDEMEEYYSSHPEDEDAIRLLADLRAAREALEFYADPWAWNKKHNIDPGGEDSNHWIPDFYSELDFGNKAKSALPERGE